MKGSRQRDEDIYITKCNGAKLTEACQKRRDTRFDWLMIMQQD